MMKTLTLRLDDALYAKVMSLAKRRKTTQSEVVRQAIKICVEDQREIRKGSALDLAKDLAGRIEAASDLSFNKDHLQEFGR
jgi:predicted transcriptional regulator